MQLDNDDIIVEFLDWQNPNAIIFPKSTNKVG